jgi:hypothetical protein
MPAYFEQSSVLTVRCTVTNVIKTGAAFAATEGNDQVFIPVRIVTMHNLDIGDSVSAFVIDNAESSRSAKYRAIRVHVERRFSDVVATQEVQQVARVVIAAPTKRSTLSREELRKAVDDCLSQPYCWSVSDMAHDIADDYEIKAVTPEFKQSIQNVLTSMHSSGEVAAAKIYANGSQERATSMFFARHINMIETLLDYEVEDK